MGSIIRAFTVGRNALKRDIGQSASAAMESIASVRGGVNLAMLKATDNGRYNVIRDLISFTGIITRKGDVGEVTKVGEAFERLYRQNPIDGWRWLLTRTLWLYVVPNGTQSSVNRVSSVEGGLLRFDFFRRFLSLLVALASLSNEERYLSFEEICRLLDRDEAWAEDSPTLLSVVVAERHRDPLVAKSARTFLADLEAQFDIPRDNFAALFGKALSQTGLFEYRRVNGKATAIALAADLDPILQRRIRFVIDNPQISAAGSWEEHLSLRKLDLPEEVSLQTTVPELEAEPQEPLENLIEAVVSDFLTIGLTYQPDLVERFVASLITKNFVLLTGLSGSGKTKLAQAFAMWISARWSTAHPRFVVGEELHSDKINYIVTQADKLSFELEGGVDGTRVTLPYGLLDEWIDVIQSKGFDRNITGLEIREAVILDTAYSTQLSSFEHQLKAAAFASLERSNRTSLIKHYEVVAVGPDWTSREISVGYVDALNSGTFVRTTPIIDLLLRSSAAPNEPFFLILDEMNLSHVERYFADFLSALESSEEMYIHGQPSAIDGVPSRLKWPQNLFVVGTVNIDETTYMFSPKVLDRANTIEFLVAPEMMKAYLQGPPLDLDISKIEGAGVRFSDSFLIASKSSLAPITGHDRLARELDVLFEILRLSRTEFGFRSAREITRYSRAIAMLAPLDDIIYSTLDAQVVQKILPRMNGSRRVLEGTLCSIAIYCGYERTWDLSGALVNRDQFFQTVIAARNLSDDSLHPLSENYQFSTSIILGITFDKIVRMLTKLQADGFASFAEA